MRIVALVVACGLTGCGSPGAAGDAETTTAVVASFGDDGSSTAPVRPPDDTTGSSGAVDATGPDPTTESSSTTGVAESSTSGETSSSSSSSSSSGEPLPSCGTVLATVRDFSALHPDMAMPGGAAILPGLVLADLGPGGVPVFDPDYAGEPSITDADTFAQWYTDVDGVNERFEVELDLYEESPGRVVFDAVGFLPIDGLGFGNEGELNNYYFTTAVHASLRYDGGEVMTFGGDDDVWVFIDGRLAADVGGQHSPQFVDVELDALGLEPGQLYPLDVFHAERGVGGVVLRFELGDVCGG